MSEKRQIIPLGDEALLVRFADRLNVDANKRAIGFAHILQQENIMAIEEIVPSLVSVLVRYDKAKTSFFNLSAQIAIILSSHKDNMKYCCKSHKIKVRYDGEDLEQIVKILNLSIDKFIKLHSQKKLNVLTCGFAPGFIYCGMHPKSLNVARREKLHANVKKGTILFAAGQSAITATNVPTGWHIIGHSDFINFDENKNPPTIIRAGDMVEFEAV